VKTKWADCCAPIIRLPITTLGETEAVLAEDWTVRVRGYEFVVPAGTRTDGASIPRILWRVCGHPLQAPRVYAGVLHDWIYRTPSVRVTRVEADRCYRALERHFGICAAETTVEYGALRLCGWRHYVARE